MNKANFGIMGLGVMGHMLALNMERNGFTVAGYDLDGAKVQAFGTDHPGKNLIRLQYTGEFPGQPGTPPPHHADGTGRKAGR